MQGHQKNVQQRRQPPGGGAAVAKGVAKPGVALRNGVDDDAGVHGGVREHGSRDRFAFGLADDDALLLHLFEGHDVRNPEDREG